MKSELIFGEIQNNVFFEEKKKDFYLVPTLTGFFFFPVIQNS